jgi:hypothetical protein
MNTAFAKTLSTLVLCTVVTLSQAQSPSATPDTERPLPDIPQLMHEVEEHQRASEAIQKNYLYHEAATQRENNGKAETHEYDVFWLNGVQVHKLTRKNGRDLTPDEQKKESERVDKEVEKAKDRKNKAEAKGRETDSRGHEEITVSRFLLLGSFTNPRRIQFGGRDTIVVDYIGDPKAKTQNRTEDVIRNLAGTLWVDEQDRTITRLEGHFVNSYKIGAGLVMNIKKDTNFSMQQKKINGEVWLPEQIDGQGAARVMLFVSFNGSIHVTNSDYRKFKATSTILPGVATVNEESPADTASPSSTAAPPSSQTSTTPQ